MQYAHAVCVAYFTPFLLQKTSMGLIRKLVSSNIQMYVAILNMRGLHARIPLPIVMFLWQCIKAVAFSAN